MQISFPEEKQLQQYSTTQSYISQKNQTTLSALTVKIQYIFQ